jgi:hypothetical protein
MQADSKATGPLDALQQPWATTRKLTFNEPTVLPAQTSPLQFNQGTVPNVTARRATLGPSGLPACNEGGSDVQRPRTVHHIDLAAASGLERSPSGRLRLPECVRNRKPPVSSATSDAHVPGLAALPRSSGEGAAWAGGAPLRANPTSRAVSGEQLPQCRTVGLDAPAYPEQGIKSTQLLSRSVDSTCYPASEAAADEAPAVDKNPSMNTALLPLMDNAKMKRHRRMSLADKMLMRPGVVVLM